MPVALGVPALAARMCPIRQLRRARRDSSGAPVRRGWEDQTRDGTDTIMSQTNVTRTTDPAWCAEEDHILDAWLASLGASDFEHILSRLAEKPGLLTTAREQSA